MTESSKMLETFNCTMKRILLLVSQGTKVSSISKKLDMWVEERYRDGQLMKRCSKKFCWCKSWPWSQTKFSVNWTHIKYRNNSIMSRFFLRLEAMIMVILNEDPHVIGTICLSLSLHSHILQSSNLKQLKATIIKRQTWRMEVFYEWRSTKTLFSPHLGSKKFDAYEPELCKIANATFDNYWGIR